eukprot:1664165-Pleurochrysis_carterae.AAC.1
MRPEQEIRSTERRRRATIEGIWGFDAVEGAVGLSRERSDTRESGGARWRRRCVRERSCGDALTKALILLLPALTPDRHVLRDAVYCRFSARGNLYRDLDLAAWRPAVLALAQS